MMFLAMLWGVLAMALFFMRPSSMRRGNGDQLQEKPRPGDNGPVSVCTSATALQWPVTGQSAAAAGIALN